MRKVPLVSGEYYHIYNRGNSKQKIFVNDKDRDRFLKLLYLCNSKQSIDFRELLGYNKVKENIPKIDFKPKINETYAKIISARNKLLNEGYSEVMTYTFCDQGEIEVKNSASDKKFLRTNLSDGFKESIKLNHANIALLGLKEIKVFEIGTVFTKNREQINVCYGDKKNITEVSLDDFCKNMPGTPNLRHIFN